MNGQRIKGPHIQALGMLGSYGLLFLLLGSVFFGRMEVVDAGRGAVFPWEIGVLIVGVFLLGALLFRRLHARAAVELLLGSALFLGVWFFCWHVFGDLGLVIAGALTLAQALYRRVWMHDVFVLVGGAGVVLYLAFLFPALTWAILLVGMAIYDTLGGRGARVTRWLTDSVVHRGAVPALVLPEAVRTLARPLTHVMGGEGVRFIGMVELLFPGIFVAHVAVFGGVAFGVTAAMVTCVAAVASWKRMDALFLLLALAATIPYLLLVLFL